MDNFKSKKFVIVILVILYAGIALWFDKADFAVTAAFLSPIIGAVIGINAAEKKEK